MSGIFSQPKPAKPLPVVDPSDTANRLNSAVLHRLAGGGTNSTVLGQAMSGGASQTGGSKAPTLTGLT